MSAAIDLAVRAAILLSIAWLSTIVLRKRAASLRALVWTIALAGTLALPLVSRVTPAWTIAAWHQPAVVEPMRPQLARADVPAEPAIADEQAPRERPRAAADEPAVRVDAQLPASSPAPATAPTSPIDWSASALFLWAALTSLLLARIAASHSRMNGLLADAGPADAAWTGLIDEHRAARGIRRGVRVLATEAVSVPAIVGVITPTLLLPSDADEWDTETRRAVVLHELAHVARWDALAQLAGQIACAVYWFVPLAWYGARRASALRERASDDEVLRAGVRASAYAERLIDLARGAGASDLQLAAVAMARPSRMRERVVAILDPAARRDGLSRRAIAVALMLSTGAIAAVAAATPGPAETVFLPSPLAAGREAAAEHAIAQPAPASTKQTLARGTAPAPAAEAAPLAEAESGAQPVSDARPVANALPASIADPAPGAAPAAAQASSRMCDGSESTSNSIHSENGRKKWTMKLTGGACKVDMRAEGEIEFNGEFTDIASIGSGGFFRLDVTEGGVRRQLEIEPRNGSLARTWRVDGREQPYDAAARAWFAGFLIELDRRTAIGAEVRIPHLLKQGGVNAVLNETAQMPSDYVRGEYYKRLAQAARLSTPDVTRILEQAATLSKSDYYATEVLKAFAGRGVSDSAQRAAVTQIIEGMDSDYYRAESIGMFVSGGRPGPAEMDFLLRMVPRIKSDHYAVETLNKVVGAGSLTPDQQAALARAAASIEGDHYATEFLRRIAGAGTMPPQARAAYLEAVRGIEGDHYASEALRAFISRQPPSAADADAIIRLAPSLQGDHYRTEMLSALLSVPSLAERDLLGIIEAARSMSDHYESETLRKVASHRAVTDRVRDALTTAAAAMSKHYGDEVRRAAGR